MTPKSRSRPPLYGHHKRLAGPALTIKFSELIDNRRPLHEFSQHGHAAGFDRDVSMDARFVRIGLRLQAVYWTLGTVAAKLPFVAERN
jgi:hypothetical protein